MAKTGVLESGGQAQREDALGGGRVEGDLVEVQGVAVLHAGQRPQNKEGRDTLGDGTLPSATPATSRWQTMTKKRLSRMFSTPAMHR